MSIATFINLNAQDDVSTTQIDTDTTLLELPGDNLDLYAVLNLFQKSKTIEAFEESLNEEKTGINNLDLNLDNKVDFIKVETKQDKNDFIFILHVDIVKDETQDVAVILISKDDDDEKITIQIVGDENLYGKDYVIEPKLEESKVTTNPVYNSQETVVVTTRPATVVVIKSEPIVKYIYSRVYAPYYSPYYYGYYPVYYKPYSTLSIAFYRSNHRHHHRHYYGGRKSRRGNTVVINNNYNSYNKTRNTSITVNRNKSKGNYKSSLKLKSQKHRKKSSVKSHKSSVRSNKSNIKPKNKLKRKAKNKRQKR